MMKRKLPSLALAGLLAVLSPSILTAAPGSTHDHGEGTAEVHLGKVTISEYVVDFTSGGALDPGSDIHLEVNVVEKTKPLPKAMRAWIGSEDASETGKTKLNLAGGPNVHNHIAVPQPLLSSHRFWVEVEDAGRKERASLPLPGVAAGEHDHEHELSASVTAVGEGNYALTLMGPEDKLLTGADLQPGNDPAVRMVVVDESLTDIRHISYDMDNFGNWMPFPFSPRKPGNYRVYTSAWLKGADHGETVLATLSNPGTPEVLTTTVSESATIDGLSFALKWAPAPAVGKAGRFTVAVTDAAGKAAKLEPVLGAKAHAFSFGKDPEHTRIIAPKVIANPKATIITGEISHAGPGYRRLFIHIKSNGKDVIAPFGYTIAEAPADDHHGHSHGPGEAHSH
ncbi:hypothetical protein GC173_08415 [bacterium]|nr:hypothetical protein [bacterium]